MTDSRHAYFEDEPLHEIDLYTEEMLNTPENAIKYLNIISTFRDVDMFKHGLKRVMEAQQPDSCLERILEEVL